jgi:hypothetical protein
MSEQNVLPKVTIYQQYAGYADIAKGYGPTDDIADSIDDVPDPVGRFVAAAPGRNSRSYRAGGPGTAEPGTQAFPLGKPVCRHFLPTGAHVGVQNIVRETSFLPFSEMKQGILNRVAAWRDGPPVDDVSLVLVEVR